MPIQSVPFTELHSLAASLGFRRASFSEIRAGMEIAKHLTGQPMASPETITWLDSMTGMAAWVTGDPVEGVFVAVPLSEAGTCAVRDGSFSPEWSALNHIAAEGEPCHGVYIGIIAGATKGARKAVMTAAGLVRAQIFGSVPCFARGATEEGKRAMASLGFGPVEGGLPDLYVQEPLEVVPEKPAPPPAVLRPSIGELALARPLPDGALATFSCRPARTLEDYQQAMAIRAAVYLAEQDCPYEEEYDGNDFSATHMVLFKGARPIGTIRLRWFADFAKCERTSVLPAFRGTPALKVLMAETFELIARKGYRLALAQIQARLVPTWNRVLRCRRVEGRQPFAFSGYDYCEIEIPLAAHPDALTIRADPFTVIRPEGAWDVPGVLDRSATRPKGAEAA